MNHSPGANRARAEAATIVRRLLTTLATRESIAAEYGTSADTVAARVADFLAGLEAAA